jgi:hypothetical protein
MPWDDSDTSSESDSGAEGSDCEAIPSPAVAVRHLVNLLLNLLWTNVISARVFCLICWWAAAAGCGGDVEKFNFGLERRLDIISGTSMLC